MSRAFVSEEITNRESNRLPERPISNRPNLVTQRGRQLIEKHVKDLQRAMEAIGPEDDERRKVLARDLRYWRSRQASARLVEQPEGPLKEVCFGVKVTVRNRDGSIRTYQLVGEDEADPAGGLLNWAAPLAAGLMGAAVGDVVDFDGSLPPVEVVAIEHPAEERHDKEPA